MLYIWLKSNRRIILSGVSVVYFELGRVGGYKRGHRSFEMYQGPYDYRITMTVIKSNCPWNKLQGKIILNFWMHVWHYF